MLHFPTLFSLVLFTQQFFFFPQQYFVISLPSTTMPRNRLGTNLNLCFTKLKRPLPPQSSSHHKNNNSMHFNSLYDLSSDSNYDSDYIYELDTTPDLATIYASRRFFFSTPGRSNSIIDSSSSSMSSSLASTSSFVGSIAIATDSPDPYSDFRRSMQEMVEARGLSDITADWDSLHKLLMCYLALNPKSTHKYIVGAFSDLIVCLMASKLDPSAGSTSKSNWITQNYCTGKKCIYLVK